MQHHTEVFDLGLRGHFRWGRPIGAAGNVHLASAACAAVPPSSLPAIARDPDRRVDAVPVHGRRRQRAAGASEPDPPSTAGGGDDDGAQTVSRASDRPV
jgi:hypothetical protein